MQLVEGLYKNELQRVSNLIGESFVSNELFHEFGNLNERKSLVLKYMDAYVHCLYESNYLFCSEDRKAFIGLAYSDEKKILPQIKLMFQLLFILHINKNKKFLNHIKQISKGNKRYSKDKYLEVLMVCVDNEYQGKGRVKELIDFAKEKASKRNLPLILDTNMERYANIYEHYGFTIYNKIRASNGVTRYNLVWNSADYIYLGRG